MIFFLTNSRCVVQIVEVFNVTQCFKRGASMLKTMTEISSVGNCIFFAIFVGENNIPGWPKKIFFRRKIKSARKMSYVSFFALFVVENDTPGWAEKFFFFEKKKKVSS